MTRKEFTKQLFYLATEGDKGEEEILEILEIFLDVLEPKDREMFSKWGPAELQVDSDKCWN